MNIQHLRQSVKAQWLDYYRENRDWLDRLGVWVTCEGKRRPSSSFILATLTTLEPQLTQLLPLIVDLTGNPDRIIIALGLNFNPDDELKEQARERQKVATNGQMKMLPAKPSYLEVVARPPKSQARMQAVPVERSIPPLAQSSPQPLPESTIPESKQPPTDSPFPESKQPPTDSPFSAPDSPFEEELPALPPTPAAPSPAAPAGAMRNPTVRPMMDTEELAAQEQPKRNTNQADASCQGARGDGATRIRRD